MVPLVGFYDMREWSGRVVTAVDRKDKLGLRRSCSNRGNEARCQLTTVTAAQKPFVWQQQKHMGLSSVNVNALGQIVNDIVDVTTKHKILHLDKEFYLK